MHWTVIAVAGLALFGAHMLRLPAGGGRIGAGGAFLVGLLASALIIKAIAGVAGIGRTTDFDRVVNRAVAIARQDPAPLLVFSGASYSRNALDDERLTAALRARGHDVRAINLSLEAASMLERRDHLAAFMERSGRVPDLVFIEVAGHFDHHVAQFFGNSKFSMRGIEQFGLSETAWTGLGIVEGACPGLTGCLKAAALTASHFALNALNVGLIARGERPEAVGQMASYDPQDTPRERVDPDQRSSGLARQGEVVPARGPQWARSVRAIQRKHLARAGVEAVGYYFPPVIDPGARAYLAGLCAGELSGLACFAPRDPVLLGQLDAPVWFDDSHLLDKGAGVYTRWLATQLVASGLLEATARADDLQGGVGQ